MQKERHDKFDDENSMSVAEFKVFSSMDVATKNPCVEQMENAENVELKPCTRVDYDPLAIGVVKIEPINGCNESDGQDAPIYYERSGVDLTMRDCLIKQESMCTDEIEIGEVKIEPVESDHPEHEEHFTKISRTSCNVLSDQSLSVQARTQQESQPEIISMPIEEGKSVVSMNTTELKRKRRLLQYRLNFARRVAKQTPQEHAEELARRRARYEIERFGTDSQGEKQQSKMISQKHAEKLARRRARYKMKRDLEAGVHAEQQQKMQSEILSMPTEETTSNVPNKMIKLKRERRRLEDQLRYVQKVNQQSPQEHAEELARRRARYKMKRDLERSSLQSSANDNMQSSEQSPSVQAEMQHESESTVLKMPIDKDTNSDSSLHAYAECMEGDPAQDNTQTSGLIEMDPLDTTKQSYDCQECGKSFTREAKLKSHSCYHKGKVRKKCSVES